MKYAKSAFDAKMSRLLRTFQPFELDAVIAKLHLLLYRHGEFVLQAIGHGSGNAHNDQHDAEVNDQPAVASLIAPGQSDESTQHAFAGKPPARAQRQGGVIDDGQRRQTPKA